MSTKSDSKENALSFFPFLSTVLEGHVVTLRTSCFIPDFFFFPHLSDTNFLLFPEFLHLIKAHNIIQQDLCVQSWHFLTALSRLFLLTYQTLYESSEKFFFSPVCSMLCTAGYHMRLIPQADHLLFFFYICLLLFSVFSLLPMHITRCAYFTHSQLSSSFFLLSASLQPRGNSCVDI